MVHKNGSADFPGWREIASLGEQLASADSLTTQRDRIVAVVKRLLRGRVDVWLHENLFRLPDWDAKRRSLNSYGWVDRSRKTVDIPVDRAMELLVERGDVH